MLTRMQSILSTIYTSTGVRILTLNAETESRAKSYAQRVDTYVSKSWIADPLVWRITSELSRRRSENNGECSYLHNTCTFNPYNYTLNMQGPPS